jgi:hypothetical protein
MFNFNKIEKEKGVSIFLSLLITTVFLSVGIGLATMFQEQKEVTKDVLAAIQSRAAAETGVEHAFYISWSEPDHPAHYPVEGQLIKFPETPKGSYEANYHGVCGEEYVSSIGSYKGSRVKRIVDTGEAEVMIIPTSTIESCEDLVASLPEWTCPASIGTDEEGWNGKYWDWTITCSEQNGGVDKIMTDDGRRCGPENEYAEWAYCRMY